MLIRCGRYGKNAWCTHQSYSRGRKTARCPNKSTQKILALLLKVTVWLFIAKVLMSSAPLSHHFILSYRPLLICTPEDTSIDVNVDVYQLHWERHCTGFYTLMLTSETFSHTHSHTKHVCCHLLKVLNRAVYLLAMASSLYKRVNVIVTMCESLINVTENLNRGWVLGYYSNTLARQSS